MKIMFKKILVLALTLVLTLSMPPFTKTHHTASAQGSGNGKIAFARTQDGNSEIYVMNPDGSNQTRLTNNPAEDYAPDWSPDGTQILFNRYGGIDYEVYVMNADGSNERNLTNNGAQDSHPRWSPDGTQIAFQSNRDGNYEIYVMNADGSNQTRLTNNPADDYEPVWSPDGEKIAFTTYRDGNWEIYVMGANGTNQTNITNNPAYDAAPSWSLNGQIAFQSNRSGDNEIFVVDAAGGNPINLTNNIADDQQPAWSPDGSHLTFISMRDGNFEIYRMDADGSNQTNLTNSPEFDEFPDWYDIVSGCSANVPIMTYQGDTFTLTVGCEDISSSVFGFQAGHTVTTGANLVTAQAASYTAGTVFQGQQTLAGPNTLPLYALSLQAGGTQATGDFTLGSVDYLAVTPGQATFDVADLILGDIDGNAIPNATASTTAATITINDLVLSLTGTIDPQGYAHANQLTFTLDGSPVYANLTSTYNATTGNTAFTHTNIKGHPASLTVDAPSHVACVESLTFPIDAGNETLPNTLILRAGDVNGDNRVNITDAAAIGQGYGLQPTGELDINHDGAVNILDLIHVGRNYGITQVTDCTP